MSRIRISAVLSAFCLVGVRATRLRGKDERELLFGIDGMDDDVGFGGLFGSWFSNTPFEGVPASMETDEIATLTGGPFSGPELNFEDFADDDDEVDHRIVGGFETEPHSFYTFLLVPSGGGHRWAGCGGTLISPCHIVTAAHCTIDDTNPISTAMVNAHRPYNNNGGAPYHLTSVEEIVPHPDYDQYTQANDIAIIKMLECVDPNEFRPAIPASPSYSVAEGTLVEILGFGKLSETMSMFTTVDGLREAHVPFMESEECIAFYGDKILPDMACGGYAEGGIDACQGDSGGPMVLTLDESTVIHLGVVSWGQGCGRVGNPGVYSSVQYHYNWISDIVCAETETRLARWCPTSSNSPSIAPSPILSSAPSAQPSSIPTKYPKASPVSLPSINGKPSTVIQPPVGQDTSPPSSDRFTESLSSIPTFFDFPFRIFDEAFSRSQKASNPPSSSPSSVPSISNSPSIMSLGVHGKGEEPCGSAGETCVDSNECCSGSCIQTTPTDSGRCSAFDGAGGSVRG